MLHEHPSAAEAVAAVRDWLRTEVVPGTEGDLSYGARVAAHLLAVVERELRAEADDDWLARRWAGLGVADEAELAAQVAAGAWEARRDALAAVLAEVTAARLEVANPAWLAPVTDDDPRG